MTRRARTPKQELEVVEIPNIARRAMALVDLELKKTIMEAADLVGVNLGDGWQIASDWSKFVRTSKVKPGKPKEEK